MVFLCASMKVDANRMFLFSKNYFCLLNSKSGINFRCKLGEANCEL
jgi:hypothetical protein